MSSTAGASRRALLTRGTAVGAATVAGALGTGLGTPADAGRYRPGRYRGAKLLSRRDHHLVKRFSYGVTPALTAQVRRAGGAREWFERQLSPERVRDRSAEALDSWWPSLRLGPQELWRRNVQEVEGGWEVMADYQRWLLLRRMRTNRPVLEMMTELWLNHLHVPANGDAPFVYRFDYDQQIRSRALGSFEDLLHTAITHPAMGLFLDNAVSTARQPNENLGRELLELHTVGRGSYTEEDVKASARILTGWQVDIWDTWDATYDPERHWTGPVRVMGFSHANADPDGRAVTRDYLRYLARHPRTAERVARRLAVKFVSDEPPRALVDRLAEVYLANGTQIRPVLRALVDSRAFRSAAGAKVRDPGEDLVATYRALRIRVAGAPGEQERHAANVLLWQCHGLGAMPFDWARPDGQPIDNDSWASPARMLASLDLHWTLAAGWWPEQGARYRKDASWLPRKRIRFDLLVDHLCQQLLGTRSNARLLKACCQAAGVGPRTRITRRHSLVRWELHRVLATILDSPEHLTR